MKKILFCLSSLSRVNGIATFVMNQYDLMISKKYKIDFLIINKNISDEKYIRKIKENGGNIFIIPYNNKINRYKMTFEFTKEILQKYKYDILHVNLVDIYAIAILTAGMKIKIQNRIYHVHNPLCTKFPKLFRNYLNKKCCRLATKLCACSIYAGKSNFKKKDFQVLNNLIKIESFIYNEGYRKKIREEYNIKDNEILIGTVGRITEQKNPIFALKIIEKLIKIDNKYKMIWVGKGNQSSKFKEFIIKNNLKGKVINVESSDAIYKFYSAFDIFILPSKFEGLGIVFIEAQASGLPILTSINIPIEVKEVDNFCFLNLNNYNEWISKILEIKNVDDRKKYNEFLQTNSKFSIANSKNENLISLYEFNSKE